MYKWRINHIHKPKSKWHTAVSEKAAKRALAKQIKMWQVKGVTQVDFGHANYYGEYAPIKEPIVTEFCVVKLFKKLFGDSK